MAAAAYEYDSGASSPLTARRLMQQGYDAISGDRNVRAGSSTACVAIARPDGILDVANLGDSGFLQLRLSAVHAYSEPQTHAFNTPFQLSIIPPSVAARMAAFGGAQLCDLPRDADVSHHKLLHGDVLVFATDGVLDNLFNQDILRVASRVMVAAGAWTMASTTGPRVADSLDALTKVSRVSAPAAGRSDKPATLQSLLATELVTAAKLASINKIRNGPFAKEVKKYYPHEEWQGGKIDDICVVVVVVSKDSTGAK
ncbi:Protein phosphatase PTC7 -like protein fig [Escovopsis weberi]|uniref:Protein phosphatase n=1 Tax=Escovopsis weberi TaxID=150374 RepID=A0A0M9VTU1_ESCWE|nr:Protein phosphatase PTC7 -like protein fig [Escovopsis weberi]